MGVNTVVNNSCSPLYYCMLPFCTRLAKFSFYVCWSQTLFEDSRYKN